MPTPGAIHGPERADELRRLTLEYMNPLPAIADSEGSAILAAGEGTVRWPWVADLHPLGRADLEVARPVGIGPQRPAQAAAAFSRETPVRQKEWCSHTTKASNLLAGYQIPQYGIFLPECCQQPAIWAEGAHAPRPDTLTSGVQIACERSVLPAAVGLPQPIFPILDNRLY